MKPTDIQRLHDAGLISEEQRQAILRHLESKPESNRFLAIVSVLGGLLISAGLILLMASNWDAIPGPVKIGAGLAAMLGAHLAGHLLGRDPNGMTRIAQALHFAGALLFLGNLALVGQVYHLHSRPPNIWLYWWLGIAALPWILRSRPLNLLAWIAFAVWFGAESWQPHGLLSFGGSAFPLCLLALLGLGWYGLGLLLRESKWTCFASDTERLGMTVFTLLLFPFTLRFFHEELSGHFNHGSPLPFGILAPAALAVLALGLSRDSRLEPAWRLRWGGVIAGLVIFLGFCVVTGSPTGNSLRGSGIVPGWIGTGLYFAFALLQIHVGLRTGAPWMVNLGMGAIAAVIIATYLVLIGTMAQTGLIFVVSGVFLIGLAVLLERKRRTLLRRIHPVLP